MSTTNSHYVLIDKRKLILHIWLIPNNYCKLYWFFSSQWGGGGGGGGGGEVGVALFTQGFNILLFFLIFIVINLF